MTDERHLPKLIGDGYTCEMDCEKKNCLKGLSPYTCESFDPRIEVLWNELDEWKEACHDWNI